MPQTVQAKCPHCQHVLQIPAEWVSQAMRCKHCKSTFHAKASAVNAPSASIPVGKPATAVAAGAPPSSSSPFGVDQASPAPSSSRRRNNNGGLLLLVVMFFFLFVLGAGGAGFVVYKAVTSNPPNRDGKPIANRDGKNTDGPASDKKGGDGEDKKRPPLPRRDQDGPATDSATKDKDDVKPKIIVGDGLFPRRALLISVNNYLYYNTVHFGSSVGSFGDKYPGSSTSVLRDRLMRPPMNFPASQVTELSDGIPSGPKTTRAHSTQKSVLEMTIKDFVDSSRAQDRILLLYAGHAVSIEDKAYLVPIDGNIKEPDSLVPLKWVYDQLAGCRAQQKILILDAFRLSPSRGFELKGTGEGEDYAMPEAFEKETLNPPPGVQVWVSCLKEQNSVELEGGSAFLQAFSKSLQGTGEMTGLSNPSQPINIEEKVTAVNVILQELLKPEKRTQVSRLTGMGGANVAYNRDEALPAQLVLKPPTVLGGERASRTQVNSVLDVLKVMPQVRDTRATDVSLLDADKLPAFSSKTLDSYKPDGYKDLVELRGKYKASGEAFAKEFPVRAAVLDALDAMQESQGVKLREVLSRGDGTNPKLKPKFRDEQGPAGVAVFKLEQALEAFKEAGAKRDMETSKRWQANFDYTQARLQSRIIYLIEYNYLLGRILADDVPELATGQTGWRIGSGQKIAVTEKKAKDLAKTTKKLWDKIDRDYPDTPWALLARRERDIALGLQWRPKSD